VEILLGRRLGMRLTFATTGARAIELARTEPPNLILLDLNLPDGSGLAVLQAVRADARTRATRVLVMSADALPDQIQTLLAAGADDYLTKPYDVHHFVRVVRDCLQPSA
jgi:CheY-like chemotaxis protein